MGYPPSSQQRPTVQQFMDQQQQQPLTSPNMSRPPMPPLAGQPPAEAAPYNYQSNIQSPMMMQGQQSAMAGPPRLPGQISSHHHHHHQQQQQQPGHPINYQQPQDPYNAQRNQYQQQQPGVNMPGSMSSGFQTTSQAQQAKRLDPDTMPSPIQDDRKLLGIDKEKTILSPQNNVYNN